jgi:ATP-dependent Clp protease ATP-binding subunit ClpC
LGRKIDFKNTIIIITSNTGTRELKDFGRGIGFELEASKKSSKEFAKGVIEKAMKKTFAPEFLNRIDEVVIFNSLDKEDIRKIIEIELAGLYQRIETLGYKLIISDEAKEFIASKGYDVQYGARPLKRAIQTYLEDEMAAALLQISENKGGTIEIEYDKTEEKIISKINNN